MEDATHQPHITTLQRFVRTADLDNVYAAVEQTAAATDIATLSYRAVALGHADWGVPGQGLAVIVVQPSSQVLDFQAALLASVTPFTDSGGTAAAFVTDPGEQISQSTIDWVDGFVPTQIGARNYIARITVGGRAVRRLPRSAGQRRGLPPRQQRRSPLTAQGLAADAVAPPPRAPGASVL